MTPQQADTAYTALKAFGRRRLITALSAEGSVEFDDIPHRFATTNDRMDPKQAKVEYYHNHIPLLEDLDVITVDGGTIRPGPRFEETYRVYRDGIDR